MMADNLKNIFRVDVLLVVHWDGKLLKDLTGNDHVDRFPIIVTGEGFQSCLLLLNYRLKLVERRLRLHGQPEKAAWAA